MNLDFIRNNFRFNVRTSVVIYSKDLSKVLLFNVEGRNFYMLPGGRMEELEESIDTVKREIKEGFDGVINGSSNSNHFINNLIKGGNTHE